MSDITQTFLKEVDDALHEERLLALWQRYKVLIIGGVVALVVATAGNEIYKAYARAQAADVAETWDSLASKPDAEQVEVLNGIAARGNVGFRSLAAMELAAKAPDTAAALAHYTSVLDDSATPVWLRDMVRLNRAMVQMESAPAAAKADLEVLAGHEDAAAMPPALELLAVLAMKEGDTLTARDLTTKLLSLPNLPADMRQRAAVRLGAVSTLAR